MPLPPENKQAQLRAAGILTAEEVPEAYALVVDSLTPAELNALVAIKTRLDRAQDASQIGIAQVFVAP